jgi:hypothetical protein
MAARSAQRRGMQLSTPLTDAWRTMVPASDDPHGPLVVWAHTGRGRREIRVPYLVFGESLPGPTPQVTRWRSLSAQAPLPEGTSDA